MELDAPGRFSTILYKGNNFCDFLYAFLHTQSYWKRHTLKGKNLLPKSTLKGKHLLPKGEQILSF